MFSVPPHVTPFEFTDSPVNSGYVASVTCIVSKGDYPVDFAWFLNNRTVKDIAGISIVRTNKRISQLNIESVDAEHAGEYTCLAKNSAGSVKYSTSLLVNGINFYSNFYAVIFLLLLDFQT